jgi:hypothetical protein
MVVAPGGYPGADATEVPMRKFRLGALIGFAVGWAVGTGRATQLWQRARSSMNGGAPGSVGSTMPRPAFERTADTGMGNGGSTAVSA